MELLLSTEVLFVCYKILVNNGSNYNFTYKKVDKKTMKDRTVGKSEFSYCTRAFHFHAE